MPDHHFPHEELRCHRCRAVIPQPLMDCPTCLGKFSVPQGPPAEQVVTAAMAATPPILAVLPAMRVNLRRRESGFIEAHMIAGDMVGKNILAGHRFEEMANAKAFVMKHLLERLGQSPVVEFGGCE